MHRLLQGCPARAEIRILEQTLRQSLKDRVLAVPEKSIIGRFHVNWLAVGISRRLTGEGRPGTAYFFFRVGDFFRVLYVE
jgi:hypothetical protein